MDVLHLRGGIGEHVRIGIGRRARHVAGMAEEIGGAPEELDAGLVHFLGENIGHLGEVAAELGEIRALRNDVAIVEGEERKAEGREHLERHVRLGPRALHRLAVPGPLEGRRAEHVGPQPGEVVPVADGGTQPCSAIVLPMTTLLRVVVAVGVGVVALRPLVFHRLDVAEEWLAHLAPPEQRPVRSVRAARCHAARNERANP